MKWNKCKLLILSCYFVAFSCFCSAAFLPQGLKLLRDNSKFQKVSADTKVNVESAIAQTDKKKKKKPQPKISGDKIAVNE